MAVFLSGQIVLLVLVQGLLPGSVVVNEFMAANDCSARDPQGQFEDWAEIYNPQNQAIDIEGMLPSQDEWRSRNAEARTGWVRASG